MHTDLHVVLSEWRNGTCASPIDFTGIKRALLCIVTCEACGSARVTENGDKGLVITVDCEDFG